MPDRWAVATGSWSNTSIWDGGTLPQPGDDVFANGFTITIDQNITVVSLRTSLRAVGATPGGRFTVRAGDTLINANIIAGTTSCLGTTASSNVSIVGNVTGGTATSANGILLSATNTICNVTGTITGGSSSSCNGITMSNVANLVCNITSSNINGGSGSSSNGVLVGGGSAVINANLTGGSSSAAHAVSVTTSSATCTVTGTLNGSLGRAFNMTNGTATINGNPINANACVVSTGRCTINLTGDITGTTTVGNIIVNTDARCYISGGNLYGGSAANRPALIVNSGYCLYTGHVFGSSNSVAITHNFLGNLTIIGNVTSTGSSNAILSASFGGLIVRGNVHSTGSLSTINCTSAFGHNVIYGNIFTGSNTLAYGISNIGACDWYIFGSIVRNVAIGVDNQSTGFVKLLRPSSGGVPLKRIGGKGVVA